MTLRAAGVILLTRHAFSKSMATRFGPATRYVASICRNPLRKLRPDRLKCTRLEARHDTTSMVCTKLPSDMKLRSPSFVRRLPCSSSSRGSAVNPLHICKFAATLMQLRKAVNKKVSECRELASGGIL